MSKTIRIHVVQRDISPDAFSETARDRVEIADINVTPDLKEVASISESLDAVSLNEVRVNDATVVLRNHSGKYKGEVNSNFWTSNGLNPDGYQEQILIFKEYLVDGG